MKRFSFLSKTLAVLLLAGLLTAAASAASFGTGTVTASALYLRVQPTTDSAALNFAVQGSSVEILADAVDGWYEVQFNGQRGYMFAEYLDVVPAPTEEAPEAEEVPEVEDTSKPEGTPETEAAPALPQGKVTLTSGWLNIRSEASMEGTKVGMIPNHTVVALKDHVDGWYQVTYQGVTGYVAERYIVPAEDGSVQEDKPAATGEAVVTMAATYLGRPYRYGASGPDAFDCSGFTSYIYRQFGVTLNRSAADQLLYNGTSVAYSDLQKGDLVFFKEFGASVAATHVGLYAGDGQFIHASSSGSDVKYSALSNGWFSARYVGARRVI